MRGYNLLKHIHLATRRVRMFIALVITTAPLVQRKVAQPKQLQSGQSIAPYRQIHCTSYHKGKQ